jgi:5-methylcytosine-specific restriction enzyme A
MTPQAAPRPCSYPGCPALVRDGSRCERHRQQERKQYDRDRARDPLHTFYSSQAWRAARRQQLAQEPLCRMCKAEGRIKVAVIADHITPIAKGGDPFGELQSLCWSHHSAKSIAEGSRYGSAR